MKNKPILSKADLAFGALVCRHADKTDHRVPAILVGIGGARTCRGRIA
jgi:hypothetical protein